MVRSFNPLKLLGGSRNHDTTATLPDLQLPQPTWTYQYERVLYPPAHSGAGQYPSFGVQPPRIEAYNFVSSPYQSMAEADPAYYAPDMQAPPVPPSTQALNEPLSTKAAQLPGSASTQGWPITPSSQARPLAPDLQSAPATLNTFGIQEELVRRPWKEPPVLGSVEPPVVHLTPDTNGNTASGYSGGEVHDKPNDKPSVNIQAASLHGSLNVPIEGGALPLPASSTRIIDLTPPVQSLQTNENESNMILSPVPTGTPTRGSFYNTEKPTCSLNLVCYRRGDEGCVLRQVQTILGSKYKTTEAYQAVLEKNPQLITKDIHFMQELRRIYRKEMCGYWRRHFSLKTLAGLRLLEYSAASRPAVVPLDDFVLQEMHHAFRHPETIKTETEWIEWVFKLRQSDKRHTVEFVEGWDSTRVAIAAMLPWLVSCLVGVIWTTTGGDAQTAFTVASFILTSGTVMLALLAVISGIESSGRS